MDRHEAYIIAGSNIDPREQYLQQSLYYIEHSGIEICDMSSIYISEPWGFEADLDFYNQAIKIITELSPENLLKKLLDIETKIGRKRNHSKTYSSRIIDLDILFYDDIVINKPELIVPHPKIQERKFVLKPLNDIAANLIHPIINQTINEMLANCQDKGKVYAKP